jgi:plasmid stabilization system protein ParE
VKIRFTPTARQQFLDAITYIRRDKPSAARQFREKAEEHLRRLERSPDSGRHIPEFPNLAFREVNIRPYRFFYRVEGTDVWVVAVWHSAQLPEGPKD